MTLIATAAAGRAFDSEPPASQLMRSHVPYAKLGLEDVEEQVTGILKESGRVGIVGPVGCGKSSVARFVTTQPGFAPIFLDVASDHDKVIEPRGFFELLISHLADEAQRITSMDEKENGKLLRSGQKTVDLPGRDSSVGGELGINWMLHGSLASELTTTLPPKEVYRTFGQMADAIEAAIDVIRHPGLVPVIVADDADRLLRLPNVDNEPIFTAFFGEVLREVVDNVDAGVLLGLDESYPARDDWLTLTEGRIEEMKDLPPIATSKAMERILQSRADFVKPDGDLERTVAWSDLFSKEAVTELVAEHLGAHSRSLRITLGVSKGALRSAAEDGADLVEARHVRAAAAG